MNTSILNSTATVTQAETASAGSRPNALARLFNPAPAFAMVSATHDRRSELQGYIAAKFDKDHNARISSFMPYLLAMTCGGSFSAAVGIRPAAGHRLFVETYLDQPVEDYVSTIAGHDTRRDSIVEIGNLVSTQGGASQLVFIMLTAVLFEARYQWVAFTATAQVEHLLKKLDFTCHALCAADPSRLGEGAAQWGTYYDNNPQVMIINVAEAMAKIGNNRLALAALAMGHDHVPGLARQLPAHGDCIEA